MFKNSKAKNQKAKKQDPLLPSDIAHRLSIQDLVLCTERYLRSLNSAQADSDHAREFSQWQKKAQRQPVDAYLDAFNEGFDEGKDAGVEETLEECNVDYINQEAYVAHCILTKWNDLHTPQEFARRVIRELKRRHPTLDG